MHAIYACAKTCQNSTRMKYDRDENPVLTNLYLDSQCAPYQFAHHQSWIGIEKIVVIVEHRPQNLYGAHHVSAQ